MKIEKYIKPKESFGKTDCCNAEVVWFDSGQFNHRYWLVCKNCHHAIKNSLTYNEIEPELKSSL